MYSKQHFLISIVVGAAIALLTTSPIPDLALVAYAGVLGVAIDFDHFLDARLVTGDWRAARYCLRNPRVVFTDQGSIFEHDELTPLHRLLSHVVIVGVYVPLVWLVSPSLAVVSAVVLYFHVLADLVADVQNHAAALRLVAGNVKGGSQA